MSATAVMLGLCSVFFGLAWISFKLNDSDSDFSKYLGVLFLALSIAVLQIVGFSALRIAEAVGMTYLSDGLMTPLLFILNAVLLLFWVGMLLRVFVYFTLTLYHALMRAFGKEVKP